MHFSGSRFLGLFKTELVLKRNPSQFPLFSDCQIYCNYRPTCRPCCGSMPPKDADGMENSAYMNQDQTALGSNCFCSLEHDSDLGKAGGSDVRL